MTNIDAFLGELLDNFVEHQYTDIDACDFQELLCKHGLCVERPITADECEAQWAQEYGYEPGDTMFAYSDEMKALMQAARRGKQS